MPLYVQRSFRLKTFGLLSAQLFLIFGEMVAVHTVLGQHNLHPATSTGQLLFYALGAITLFVVLWLQFIKDRYPANYVMLVVATMLVGLFWGLTPFLQETYLHFQVIGILAIAMAVSAVTSAALTTEKVRPWPALAVSHLLGWVVGCSADVLIMQYTHLGTSPLYFAAASCVTLLLLTGVLLLDAGPLLVKCNPDDFMRVIVAMDSALLVVSMPIFVLSCCLLHSAPADAGARGQEGGNGGAPAGAAEA